MDVSDRRNAAPALGQEFLELSSPEWPEGFDLDWTNRIRMDGMFRYGQGGSSAVCRKGAEVHAFSSRTGCATTEKKLSFILNLYIAHWIAC